MSSKMGCKTNVASAKKIISGGKVMDESVMKKSGEGKAKSKPVVKDAPAKFPKVRSDSFGKR